MRGGPGRWFGSAGQGLRTAVFWKQQHELLPINTIFPGKPYRKFSEIFCPQNTRSDVEGAGHHAAGPVLRSFPRDAVADTELMVCREAG